MPASSYPDGATFRPNGTVTVELEVFGAAGRTPQRASGSIHSVKRAIVSVWGVCGNWSTGWTDSSW